MTRKEFRDPLCEAQDRVRGKGVNPRKRWRRIVAATFSVMYFLNAGSQRAKRATKWRTTIERKCTYIRTQTLRLESLARLVAACCCTRVACSATFPLRRWFYFNRCVGINWIRHVWSRDRGNACWVIPPFLLLTHPSFNTRYVSRSVSFLRESSSRCAGITRGEICNFKRVLSVDSLSFSLSG